MVAAACVLAGLAAVPAANASTRRFGARFPAAVKVGGRLHVVVRLRSVHRFASVRLRQKSHGRWRTRSHRWARGSRRLVLSMASPRRAATVVLRVVAVRHRRTVWRSHVARVRVRAPAAPPAPPDAAPSAPDPCAGYRFCDEFNGSALDTSKWIAVNSHADRSNGEPGCYTSHNVSEGSGVLTETIEHRTFTCPDATGSNDYPTGAIQMKSFSFTYGTVDVRAKVAGCGGCWPAIWMLGADCQSPAWLVNGNDPASCHWPNAGSQEIDVAEFLSSSFTAARNNLITSAGTQSDLTNAFADGSSNFHVYTLVWSPGSLVFKVDGKTQTTYTDDVPSTPMFLIVNTSIGGNGGSIDNATLPARTQIDYVHVS